MACLTKIPLLRFEEVTSTMDVAYENVTSYRQKPPFSVIASVQQKGRGRRGNHWQSLAGNLHATIVLNRDVFHTPELVSLSVSLAMYQGLCSLEIAQEDLSLKWPNDLLLCGMKVGGAIVESQDDVLLIGIGINLNHAPKEPVRYPATCLLDILNRQNKIQRLDCLTPEGLLKVILGSLEVYCEKDAVTLCAEWMKYADPRHRNLIVHRDGQSDFRGSLVGVTHCGCVLLRNVCDNEVLKIRPMEVSFSLQS